MEKEDRLLAIKMFFGGIFLAFSGLGLGFWYHSQFESVPAGYAVNFLSTLMLMAGIFLVGVVVTFPKRHLYGDELARPPGGDFELD